MLWNRNQLAFAVLASCILKAGLAQEAKGVDGYWLGTEPGPDPTGTFETLLIDQSRSETTTADLDDKRHVMVQVWYPAEESSESEKAPYVLSPALFGDAARWWLDTAETRRTQSVLNAPIMNGEDPLPVLIYNHGGGFPYFTGTFQTEFLASHGYVVVSVAHAGLDGIERYPDGYEYQPDAKEPQLSDEQRSEMTTLEQYRWMWDNDKIQSAYARDVEDITFVLDQIDDWNRTPNHPFYGRLDLERVGSFGWSIGGATSIEATVDEPRILAAINLDGWLYGRPVEASGAPRPIMLIGGSESSERIAEGAVDPAFEELNAEVNRRLWNMLRLTKPNWYRVTIVGAGHGHFSDLTTLLGGSAAEGINPERAHRIIDALTLEFFDKYLRGIDRTPLLSGADTLPEVRLVTRASE